MNYLLLRVAMMRKFFDVVNQAEQLPYAAAILVEELSGQTDTHLRFVVVGEVRGAEQRPLLRRRGLVPQRIGFALVSGEAMLHRAQCFHMEFNNPVRLAAARKIASTDRSILETWASKADVRVTTCSHCT